MLTSFRSTLPTLSLSLLSLLCLAGAALPPSAFANANAGDHRVMFDHGEPYARVGDGDHTSFVGSKRDDFNEMSALKQHYSGNFIWFREGGKSYIVRDPATLAKVDAAWTQVEAASDELKRFGGQMRAQGDAMKALGQKMQAARGAPGDVEALSQQMDEQGNKMDALGKQMDARGKLVEQETKRADATSRAALHDALQRGLAQAVAPAVAVR